MMNEPVHDRHGYIVVGEELAPVGKIFVGRQDNRPEFIEAVDQLKQVIHALSVHR